MFSLVRLAVVSAFVFFISAPVFAEPNVGLTTVDELFSRGECEAAVKVAYPHAQNGEPWAQFRVGALYIDEKCHINKLSEAMSWLKAAASYDSKTPWDRGSSLTFLGPTGFFNARSASTKASLELAEIFRSGKFLEESWFWISRAMSQYDESESERAELERILKKYESYIPEARLASLRACGTVITCTKAKIPDPPLKPLTANANTSDH